MPRSSARRRQRSVRASSAVSLLTVASLAVATALVTGAWVGPAAAVSLLAGWGAARIIHTELLQARREHARDRARQARSFEQLLAARSQQQLRVARELDDRLAGRERDVRELEGTLRLLETRAVVAEDRGRREGRRVVQAQGRVAELELALAIRSAEEADELATWSPHDDPARDAGIVSEVDADLDGDVDVDTDVDTVVDMLAWEQRGTSARRFTGSATRQA